MNFSEKVVDTFFICAYKGSYGQESQSNITLPEDLVQEVKIQAVRDNTTFSQIVEELLREYLNKKKRKENPKQAGLKSVSPPSRP